VLGLTPQLLPNGNIISYFYTKWLYWERLTLRETLSFKGEGDTAGEVDKQPFLLVRVGDKGDRTKRG